MKKILILLVVILLGACGQQKITDITLLHINDTHSKHFASIREHKETGIISTNGGSAQLAALIKKLKAENPNSLALHGGDAVTGSAFSLVYKGIDSTHILNLSSIDVAVLGNHEFDFGLDQAYHIITNRNFPTITANVYEEETGKALLPSTFTTNINGKSIGFVGLLTSREVYTGKDKPGQFTVSEEISSLSNTLAEHSYLKTNDLLILLSHTGVKLDQQIAEIFPNVFDVIIGGHSHTYLEQPIQINDTLIVQLNSNIKELGKLDISVNDDNDIVSYVYNAIPIQNIIPDPAVEEYIMAKQGLVDQQMGGKLSSTSLYLEDKDIRIKSTALGNFITDTIFNSLKDRNVDVLFLNSGGIRSSLDKGDITLGKIYEIHPFDNTIVSFKIKGKDLKAMLSHSANEVYGTGGFLQMSTNTSVTVEKDGSISSVTIRGQEINDEKLYAIMTSDWTFNGGDSYTMIKPNAQDIQYLGFDVRDIIIEEIKKIQLVSEAHIDSGERWIIK